MQNTQNTTSIQGSEPTKTLSALFGGMVERMKQEAVGNEESGLWIERAAYVAPSLVYIISAGYVPGKLKKAGVGLRAISHRQVKEFLSDCPNSILQSAQFILDAIPGMSDDERKAAYDGLDQLNKAFPVVGAKEPLAINNLLEIASGERITPETDFKALARAIDEKFKDVDPSHASSFDTAEMSIAHAIQHSRVWSSLIEKALPNVDADTIYTVDLAVTSSGAND